VKLADWTVGSSQLSR